MSEWLWLELPLHTPSSATFIDLDPVTLTLGNMAELGMWPN